MLDNERASLRSELKAFIGASDEEIDDTMNSLDEIQALINFLHACDTDLTCEPSDKLVAQIIKYLLQ